MKIPVISSILKFISKVFSELKKVDWITREQTVSYTITVVFFLIIGTLFILGIDKVFSIARSEILLQNF